MNSLDVKDIELLIKRIVAELKSKHQTCEVCGKDLTEDFDATSTLTVQNYSFEIEEDICQNCAYNIENLVQQRRLK